MNLDQQNYWWRISQSEIRNSAAAKSEGGQKSESLILVGEEGFEPSSLAAHAPRTCVFTGFHHSPIFMPLAILRLALLLVFPIFLPALRLPPILFASFLIFCRYGRANNKVSPGELSLEIKFQLFQWSACGKEKHVQPRLRLKSCE